MCRGGALSHTLGFEWFTVALSALSGGSVAWLICVFPRLKAVLTQEWNKALQRRHASVRSRRLQRAHAYSHALFFLALASTFGLATMVSATIFGAAVYMGWNVLASTFLALSLICAAGIAAILLQGVVVGLLLLVDIKMEDRYLILDIRKVRDDARHFHAIAVARLIYGALPLAPRALMTLFVRVHTPIAGVCFVYAGVGTVLGAALTQNMWVVPVSGIIALVLGTAMHKLAERVPTTWTLAR